MHKTYANLPLEERRGVMSDVFDELAIASAWADRDINNLAKLNPSHPLLEWPKRPDGELVAHFTGKPLPGEGDVIGRAAAMGAALVKYSFELQETIENIKNAEQHTQTP